MAESNDSSSKSAQPYQPSLPSTSYSPSPAPTGTYVQPEDSRSSTAQASVGYEPSLKNIAPSIPPISPTPDSQSPGAANYVEEPENRRTKLSSNLIEQRHGLIGDVGRVLLVVIVALYLIFAITLCELLLNGKAFEKGLPVQAVVLLGMSGSIPTVLSITLMVGLFKDKDSKDEKSSTIDASSVIKVFTEVIKAWKSH